MSAFPSLEKEHPPPCNGPDSQMIGRTKQPYAQAHPGRVERVNGVSGKVWPALAGSVSFPYHLKEGTTTRKGRGRGRGGQDGRPSRRFPVVAGCWSIGGEVVAMWWRCGGDVVAIASPRIGRGSRPSLSLSADTSGRSGERLAMVWTVKTSDGAEGEARNWRRGRRHPSHWFSLFLVARFLCPTSPPEGRERERGRGGQDGRLSRRCPGSLSSWLVCPFALPFHVCFCSFSIYNKVCNIIANI